MSSVVSFTFNKVELEVVTVDGKEWCGKKEVCKALEYERKTGNVIKEHCSCENIAHKYQLSMVTATVITISWLPDSEKYDFYINEEGMYELLFSSQQPKAEAFRKYCCNTMFLHVRKQLEDKLSAEIDELTIRIKTIQFESEQHKKNFNKEHQEEMTNLNEEHQEQVQDLVRNRHVPRAGGIDTVLQFVQKNEQQESRTLRFRYCVIRCQERALENRLNILRNRYPNMRLL